MKQIGNLIVAAAKRKNVLLQVFNGKATVRIGEGPDRKVMKTDWTDDETVSKIIYELNFGKFKDDAI